jgi:hypothetical protein
LIQAQAIFKGKTSLKSQSEEKLTSLVVGKILYTLTCIGYPILSDGDGIASWNIPAGFSLCHVFCLTNE